MRLTDPNVAAHLRWLNHTEKWRNCQECPLCAQRSHIVLARGVVPCDVLFCGEAPGVSEDASGLPFDGPAGQLLDSIVMAVRASTSVKFTDAYTNLVACFPLEAKQSGDNHQPSSEEIQECSPRLQEFADICDPKLVVTVGKLADEWAPMALSLDQERQWCTITHPAAILRMPAAQKDMAVRKCVVVLRDAIEKALIPF